MHPPVDEATEGKFLLTGASGWFGKTALWEYEQLYGPQALRSDVVAFASTAKDVDFGSPHGPMPALPLHRIGSFDKPRGLIHLAFLTRDQLQHMDVPAYIAGNRAITHEIEQLTQQHPQLPIITTSSGAAAALDISQLRLEDNPYAWLKQEEEHLWKTSAQSRMALVFRVYAASGRFLKSPKLFALGDFIEKALTGQRIVIASRRPVLRSYVHVGTLMKLCWELLRQPLPPGFQQINACTETLSLIDLAKIISRMWHLPDPQAQLDRDLSPDRYTADSNDFLSLLKDYQVACPSLEAQIRETAKWMQSNPGLA